MTSLHSQVKAVEEENSRLQASITALQNEIAAAQKDVESLKVENTAVTAENYASNLKKCLITAIKIGVIDENAALATEVEALKARSRTNAAQQTFEGDRESPCSTSHPQEKSKLSQLLHIAARVAEY